MSFNALAWAAKQKTGALATKAVLLALANYADEHGCSYPSTAAIADFGEMDHKTATNALDRLVKAGLISDTGNREGRTKQVKVYRLEMESQPKAEAFQKRKPSVFSAKAPQKRVTDTIREPVPKKASPPLVKRERAERVEGYHRLPDDWTPTRPLPVTTQAKVDQWPPGKFADELAALHRWAANADNARGKGRKLDWDKAFVNWLERADNDWKPRNGTYRNNGNAIDTRRGPRPDPAFDLFVSSARALASAPPDSEPDFDIGDSLPAYLQH